MANNYPDNRASIGQNPLGYLGVRPISPPSVTYRTFDPTPQDWQNFNLGAFWVNYTPTIDDPTAPKLWVLLSLANNQALWVLISGSGSGAMIGLTGDTGIALPTAGFIKIQGTANQIVTHATSSPGNVNVAFTPSIIVLNNITAANGNVLAFGNVIANGTGIAAGVMEALDVTTAATGATVNLFKTHGGAIVHAGENLGQVQWDGLDGTNFVMGAMIQATVVGTPGVNRVGTDLKFYTHPDSTAGGTNATLRMTIASTGKVTIAAPDTGSTGGALVVNPTPDGIAIIAPTGNIQATAGGIGGATVYASGDLASAVSLTAMTNVVNTTQSTGALSILSTTANPGNNTGFLKFYVGTTPVFVPYFANIAP